jgi:O-antigen/teichoic acid export membrane protein
VLRRILQYGSFILGANVLVALVTFAVGMLGARERSKEAFGDYATYVLIYSIGMTLVTSGANQTIQKYGADDGDRARFASLAYRGLFLLLLLSLVGAPGVAFFAGGKLALGALAIPLMAFITWTRSIVRSRFDAKFEAWLVLVGSLSKSLTQLSFITMSDVDAALIYGDFLGIAFTALFCFWLLAHALELSILRAIRLEIGREFLRKIAGFGWPLWIAGEVYTVRGSILSSFTRVALGTRELAALTMMDNIQKIATKPSELFGQAALPGLVRAETDRAQLYRRALSLSLYLFPLLGIASAGASPLILELFDVAAKYPEVPSMMLVSTLVIPAAAVETTLLQYSVAEGKSRAIMAAQIFTLILLGALLYPFAGRWGVYGLVAAGAIGHATYCAALLFLLRESHPREARESFSLWLRASFACAAAVLVLHLFGDAPHAWLLAIPTSVGYALALWLLGVRFR